MDRVRQPAAQWLRRHPRWPILVLLAAWLAAALWLGNDFGSTFENARTPPTGRRTSFLGSWPEEDLGPAGFRRVYAVQREGAVLAALWQR